MSWSGLAKRASTEAACAETGVRARFLVGRRERGSAEVGTESGPSADMVMLLLGVLSVPRGWIGVEAEMNVTSLWGEKEVEKRDVDC